MSGHRKWAEIRAKRMSEPGFSEGVAAAQAELDEEIRQYEERHRAMLAQADLTGQIVVPRIEATEDDDVSLAEVEEYLDSVGARLELFAVFDDGRRFPVSIEDGPDGSGWE